MQVNEKLTVIIEPSARVPMKTHIAKLSQQRTLFLERGVRDHHRSYRVLIEDSEERTARRHSGLASDSIGIGMNIS